MERLTIIELAVCAGYSKGLEDTEIATGLGLTARAVRSHGRRIRHKLGVRTRYGAAAMYARTFDGLQAERSR